MGRKRMYEIKPLLSQSERNFFNQERIRFSLNRLNGKDDWTMDDLLEFIVLEKMKNKHYLSDHRKWLKRNFSLNDSTYTGDMANLKWQPVKRQEEYKRLSVRFHVDWHENIKRYAYALDLRPAETVRKILLDYIHESVSNNMTGKYLYVVND